MPNTVGTGISTSNHDHIFIRRRDIRSIHMVRVEQAFGIGVEELHGEMDAAQVTAFCRQVRVVLSLPPHKTMASKSSRN